MLGVAGLLVKLLGAFFRIPLQALIGEEGMAYYGYAYPLYSLFLVVATAGIPVAISRLVSERLALKDPEGAHRVFRVSSWLLFFIGLVCFIICYFGAGAISKYVIGDMGAQRPLEAIAPALDGLLGGKGGKGGVQVKIRPVDDAQRTAHWTPPSSGTSRGGIRRCSTGAHSGRGRRCMAPKTRLLRPG